METGQALQRRQQLTYRGHVVDVSPGEVWSRSSLHGLVLPNATAKAKVMSVAKCQEGSLYVFGWRLPGSSRRKSQPNTHTSCSLREARDTQSRLRWSSASEGYYTARRKAPDGNPRSLSRGSLSAVAGARIYYGRLLAGSLLLSLLVLVYTHRSVSIRTFVTSGFQSSDYTSQAPPVQAGLGLLLLCPLLRCPTSAWR